MIPYTLAENAGLDPITFVTELRNKHIQGYKYDGLNIKRNKIEDMLEQKVVQPLLVSLSALTLATECVRMILKIDDIVMTRWFLNIFTQINLPMLNPANFVLFSLKQWDRLLLRLLVNFLKLIQKYLLSLLFLIFFILKSPYFPFVLFQVKHLKFLQEDHQLNPHSFRHNPKELK